MGDWRSRLRSLVTGRRDRGAGLGLHEADAGLAPAESVAGAVAAEVATTEAATAETAKAETAPTETPAPGEPEGDGAVVAGESPVAEPVEPRAETEVEVGTGEEPLAAGIETTEAGRTAEAVAGADATATLEPAAEAVEPAARAEVSGPLPITPPAAETPADEPRVTGATAVTEEARAPGAEAAPEAELPEPEAVPPAAPEAAPALAPAVTAELESLRGEARRLEAALAEEREQRKRLEAELAGLSDHDPLTGLVSARRFNDRLGLAVTHALRQRYKLAIVQLGLDRFEAVDGGVGSSHGNDLLRSVALALEGTLRQGDTIARLGPDAVFTIMLPGVKHDDDVTVIADKLRLALRSPFSVGGSDLLVTASIGIALFPDDGSDTDSLLRSAALAMERAREKGGDAWDVHAPESRARAAQRQAREAALRRALVRGGLELYWQPVVTCDTRTIVGMESLLRWRGGDRPPLPADFVTLADVSGLAVPLGQWLLRAACRQAGRWRELGHADLVVSVGISARQLAHASFVKLVGRVLDEAAVPAATLELEIPERELANAPELALARLADLRRLGIRVALDAFGTADSHVADPHRYPLDTLKIDASVVREAVSSADRAAVIRACIALARSRRLRVVAAGVETEALRALLVRLHCDHMQGRLCGAPMPAREAEAVLGARPDRPSARAQGAGGRRLT
jgi:diguanylate cyclase (GGDEF)-like protein